MNFLKLESCVSEWLYFSMPFCGKNLAWNEDLKKYPKIDIEDPEHINLILHVTYAI